MNLAQFRYWKKRLLRDWSADAVPDGGAGFIAVQMASVGATVVVVLNERLRVDVYPGFDPATLRAVIQVLSTDALA